MFCQAYKINTTRLDFANICNSEEISRGLLIIQLSFDNKILNPGNHRSIWKTGKNNADPRRKCKNKCRP